MNYKYLWIFTFTVHFSEVYSRWLEIRLPNDVPQREGYFCKYEHLPRGTSYALKFVPRLFEDTVERMFLFGCSSPRHFKKYWACSQGTSPCEKEEDEYLIFAWTKNVQSVEIPENVGFKLGSYTKSKYIVLQVYYSSFNRVEQLLGNVQSSIYDGSGDGIDVYLTATWQKYLAGIYSFSSKEFKILPSSQKYHIDIGCRYNGKRIAPFAYRCEANSNDGQAVLAYRIRKGSWTLIGKANPHDPQGFYPIADGDMMVIKPGDYLALRCVYDVQNLDGTKQLSDKGKTEMCNFYLMYYMLNKNIPSHQYEEQCDSLMQNVMTFPSEDNNITTVTTELPTTTTTTVSKTAAILNKTNLINKKIISVQTSSLPIITSSLKPVESKQTHPTSSGRIRIKPNIVIDSYYVGPQPTLVDDWIIYNDDSMNSVGFICSVALSKNGDVVALHRGSRNINVDSFDDEHYYIDFTKPIKKSTIVHIDSITGKVLKSFGTNIFYLPHSLTIDDENNYWITDIALHQVIKFSSSNTKTPSLILGEATIPGSDNNHFCKPTDVTVDKHGNIFVADGYCNSRIMKYNKNGKLIKKWGTKNFNHNLKNEQFITPHSLSIDDKLQHLYVSDLRKGNILKFDTDGKFLEVIKHIDVNGKLFSIDFNHAYGGIIYTLSGFYKQSGAIGHIISTKTGKLLTKWNIIDKNIVNPHDLVISKDNTVLYLSVNSELLKFNINRHEEQVRNFGNTIMNNNEGKYYSEIKIIKPIEDDKSVLPAVIVVTILAIPVFLVVMTMLGQHIIMKFKRNKVSIGRMQKHRFWNTNNEILCYGCCITRKHYYDGNRGLDNFMTGTDEESDCDEEDLFTGKA